MSGKDGKLGVISLAALVVSAMIGGGIFSMPQNMAQNASALAVAAAWVITIFKLVFSCCLKTIPASWLIAGGD